MPVKHLSLAQVFLRCHINEIKLDSCSLNSIWCHLSPWTVCFISRDGNVTDSGELVSHLAHYHTELLLFRLHVGTFIFLSVAVSCMFNAPWAPVLGTAGNLPTYAYLKFTRRCYRVYYLSFYYRLDKISEWMKMIDRRTSTTVQRNSSCVEGIVKVYRNRSAA